MYTQTYECNMNKYRHLYSYCRFVFNSCSSHGGLSSLGDAAATPDPTLHPHSAPTPDGAACPSSDEGENEEREESADKLDCHYSGYHPRPAAVSTSLSPPGFSASLSPKQFYSPF